MSHTTRIRTLTSQIRSLLIYGTLTALLTGCGTKGIEMVDAYDTDRFNSMQMATLYISDDLSVYELDGKRVGFKYLGYSGQAIRLGPGNHTAQVNYRSQVGTSSGKLPFSLPKPGIYFLGHTIIKKDGAKYVKMHVSKCGTNDDEKLRKAHEAKLRNKYKNGCTDIEA